MQQSEINQQRYFLKDSIRKTVDFSRTDQNIGVPPPPIEKPYHKDKEVIPLIPPSDLADLYAITLQSAITQRKSRRRFKGESISLTELSFLLWATQGIRKTIDYGHALRTVPSAGARHALETYLAVLNVDNLGAGFYRYLPVSHSILVEKLDDLAGQKLNGASFQQGWMANAAVVFIWTTIPYRMEWRYGLAAHRVILLDAGHVCQNLYLACEAVGVGTCAVAAYDQEKMDQLLEIDGDDEFVIYAAAVGRPR
ncbi:MAG: SagB/ThcOx family dehydrogenase [Planctomycetota bacterium]|jgi:SagB-type dehydrogenase family enzyme